MAAALGRGLVDAIQLANSVYSRGRAIVELSERELVRLGNAKLRTLAGELRRVIETVPVPVASVDDSMSIEDWNDACADFFGLSRDEVLGKPFAETCFGPSQRATVQKLLVSALSGIQTRDDAVRAHKIICC
eukprot:tig00021070_g17880.t1